MNLPVLPDPSSPDFDPAHIGRLAAQVVAWAAQVDEVDPIVKMWAGWSAIAEYVSKHGVTGRCDAEAGSRRLEVRIGQVNVRPGAGRPAKNSPRAGNSLPSQRVSEFGQMADHVEVVEDEIAKADDEHPPYRRVVLRAIDRDIRQRVDATARFIDEHLDVDDVRGDRFHMLYGRLGDRLDTMPAGSVDMIITDPPYPAESLPVWTELAHHAARLLVPKGILTALSGKIVLPAVMEALAEHLAYGWVYCQPLPGSSSRILARHIGQEWKPWLAYSNGAWPSGRIEWHPDMLTGVANRKERYRWEQSEEPAGELIDVLCPPGGLVLDPFCGSGTYGAAALKAGRRFVGVEADAHRFTHAAERLEAL